MCQGCSYGSNERFGEGHFCKRERQGTAYCCQETCESARGGVEEIQDAQKRSFEAAEECSKRATNTAAQPVTSPQRITEVEEDAKKAADRLADMQSRWPSPRRQ